MSDTRNWQMLAVLLLLGALLYLLAPILTPFAVSALLAYLGDPLVDRLEARRLSRTLSVLVVFLIMTAVMILAVLLLIPMLERQLVRLIEQLPRYIGWLQDTVLPWIEAQTGFRLDRIEPGELVGMLRGHWEQAGGIATTVLGGITKSGGAVLLWLTNLALIPVVTFYLLRDWDVLVARLDELLPRSIEPTVARLAAASDDVLGSFLRGQLAVMVSLGTIYAIGLWLVGIDLALLIGMLAGLVSFIPYLGAIVGVGAGVIAALVQFGDITHLALVLLVFGVGQMIESFVLTPWLVGDRIGLHPVAVIFAIMAGGQLFGFLGVLLALPVAAVVMVVLRYLHERYTASALYAGDPEPPEPVAGAGPRSNARPPGGAALHVDQVALRAADAEPVTAEEQIHAPAPPPGPVTAPEPAAADPGTPKSPRRRKR